MKHILALMTIAVSLTGNVFSQNIKLGRQVDLDSLKCKTITRDWRGNVYAVFKRPDTSVVSIKVFDSLGYVRRIKAHRLTDGVNYIFAEGDYYYIHPMVQDVNIRFLRMDNSLIKPDEIDSEISSSPTTKQ